MNFQIVVPMAGEGSRFVQAGYKLPKPLIPVNGMPMVVRAVRDLPESDHIIFLVRTSHIEQFEIDRELRKYFPDCRIVAIHGLTEGQACTVRMAREELIPDRPVIVSACDNTHLYNRVRHEQLIKDGAECLIWTYRNDPRVLFEPTAHGWVAVHDSFVSNVSCKIPISDNILHDHAVSGFFTFAHAGKMIEFIDNMVDKNIRMDNEFYMDLLPNVMLEACCDVRVFEVDKYIGWGTPQDYENYLKWESFFSC